MVWIYGGAYKLGHSGSPGYDAQHLARALEIFRKVFQREGRRWVDLVPRLARAGLFPDDPAKIAEVQRQPEIFESGGRVAFLPVGSPIMPVKSPMRKMTRCPSCWKCRILRSSTVCPRWRSGAVGSKPSLMRNLRPLASFFANSSSTISSSAPRRMV